MMVVRNVMSFFLCIIMDNYCQTINTIMFQLSQLFVEELSVDSSVGLFRKEDESRSFKRSYKCDEKRELKFDGSSDNFTSVVNVEKLQVQAFEFSKSSGEFDSGEIDGSCNRE